LNARRLSLRATRPLSATLALAITLSPFASLAQQPKPTPAQTAEAKTRLLQGDKAARAGTWDVALEKYGQAHALAPSAQTLVGVANAHYQLKHYAEAYEAYDEYLKTFGTWLGAGEKAAASKRLKEIGDTTGYISIRVNESGASVSIDDKSIGTSPVSALVRVAVGTHKVRVVKDGFSPFEAPQEVMPNGKTVVDVALTRASNAGHLAVKEKTGQTIRVLVDGVDVGAAPWEGDVAPGKHDVSGRGAAAYAPPQSVDVTKGQRIDVELVAVNAIAHVMLKTSDGKGNIYIDGQIKGEGVYAGDLAIGPHVIAVTREGYDRYVKKITLSDQQAYAETITLKQTGVAATAVSSEDVERPYEGVYGGFGLLGLYEVTDLGSELDINCPALGAKVGGCATPHAVGGGAFGYVGYTFNPVGFELFLGATGDGTQQKASFDGKDDRGVNTPLAQPRRDETFTFIRYGGMAAFRVRAAVQGRAVRASIAAGLGLAFKAMEMRREARTPEGLVDIYVPPGVLYVSPGISADAAIHLRVGRSTAFSFGVMLWAENASTWGSNSTPADPHRVLSGIVPIPTPSYHLATDAQIFIAPYLGMTFGP
jgi:hypothetical protein